MATTDPAPEAVEAQLEETAPGYLGRVRRLAAARSLPATLEGRVGRALDTVEEASRIDVTPPVISSRRMGRVMKEGVGTLVRFYMIHLADQVTDLGNSVSWMGRSLADYVSHLESEVTSLRAQVDDLEERVRQLEEGR